MAKQESSRDEASESRTTAIFGERLRQLREASGLTQEELAGRAGLSADAIGALERGKRRRPYPHTVRSLADALELDEEERASLLASVPKRSGGRVVQASVPELIVPVPPTPLFGRERALEEITAFLERPGLRLLTLTGIGGVGKTRLALEAAARMASRSERAVGRFLEGVAFVPLASLSDPALVVPTVARSLGLRETGEQTSLEVLQAYLREKGMLLVLDNLEHLLGAAAEVAALIEACPNLTVLATSRSPLRIRGEQEYPVKPLVLPVSAHAPDAGEVLASPSGRLFVERAQAASPEFAITAENATAIAAICWHLAGLPLALELVAAGSRYLSPQTLLLRLDRTIQSGWARDLPERQRTMHATLNWSYELLAEPEQLLFRRLSMFAGGFTLEAAEAVGATVRAEPGRTEETAEGTDDVLELLGRLVEQSLVTVRSGAAVGRIRYGMLEPVRQYALEKLLHSSDEEQVRGRHADYYEALSLRAREKMQGTGQVEWMEWLGREHDNLRVAMGWLLDRGETERVVEIGWNMLWFWFVRGFSREGQQWMRRTLVTGTTLCCTDRAKALTVVGALEWAQGAYAPAAATLAESTWLARDSGDSAVLATALQVQAFTALTQGAPDLAAASANESSRLHKGLGDGSGASIALLAAAHAAGVGGDPAGVFRLIDESEALARESGAPFSLASTLNVRAMFMQLQGDDARTIDVLRESLGLSRALRDAYALGYGLIGLAGALVAVGQGERAARLYGAAEALREVTGTPIQYSGHQALYERQLAALRAQLDVDAFEAAWTEGRTMTLEEAVAEALKEHD